MKIFQITAIVIILLCLSGYLGAAEHLVKQEGNTFSEIFLKVEKNEPVKFINLDLIGHKLSYLYKGEKKTLTKINPGRSQTVEFSEFGVYDIQCEIHPKMKMTVYVPYYVKVSYNDIRHATDK